MDFGVALDFGRHSGRLDRLMDSYAELLASVEDLPIHSVWAGEAYVAGGSRSSHVASPLPVLAALARSMPFRVGVGVTLLPAWHPLRLAYDGAILDQLSGGRFILGTGVGRPGLWEAFGVPRDQVATFVDETLRATRALWAGERGFDGELIRIGQGIDPLPIQSGGPPIWIGGKSSNSLRRTAAYGDVYFAGSSTRRDELEGLIDGYRRALADLDRDPSTARVAVNRVAVVAETRSEAARLCERYLRDWWDQYRARGIADVDFPEAGPSLMLLGSVDDVVDQIDQYRALGVDHLNLRIAPGDLPLEVARDTLNEIMTTVAGEPAR